jgi:hypothetical protein
MIRRTRFSVITERESGAYAVLYAVLVVVLLGMGSIVVDVAGVRADRRDNRAGADSAVIGAGEYLNPLTGVKPEKACERAWDYLRATLSNFKPALAGAECDNFHTLPGGVTPSVYCNTTLPALPTLIRDERRVGNRSIIVAWPVPYSPTLAVDGNFLTPDLAPGSVTQAFQASVDGSPQGCDRIGVAIIQDRRFGLASGIGFGGKRSSVHSVARFASDRGNKDQVAALNVLNPNTCNTLTAGGSGGDGFIIVGPQLDGTTVVGPGLIAAESDGSDPGSECNGKTVIDTNGTNSLICASSVRIVTGAADCDGLGKILSHALDPGGQKAFQMSDVTGGNVKPQPSPEGQPRGWHPVTKLFGCNTLTPCIEPGDVTPGQPNYIRNLVAALGSGTPSDYLSSQSPYTYAYTGTFTPRPEACPGGPGIKTVVQIPAGNNFVNCTIDIANGGTLIVKGGTLVVAGGISVASGGCLVVNSAVSSCPVAADIIDKDKASATTAVPPIHDAIVYLRGTACSSTCGISDSGNMIMPQTFVYAADPAKELSVDSTGITMWTAPGAGSEDANKRTPLERECLKSVPAPPTVNKNCLNSRFSRLVYWSEYAAPTTKPNVFSGQGQLSVVGVFFTPRAAFKFTGGSTYKAAAAQFWADSLLVTGNAKLGVSPDNRTAIESQLGAVLLIR